MADAPPRVRIARACGSLGAATVIATCYAAMRGEDVADAVVIVLGGAHGQRLLDDGLPDHQRYWLRVWGARGLLWAGPGSNVEPLRAALHDDAWRVREMAAKVIARHLVGDLLTDVAELETDPVPRVRAAAGRALSRLVDAGA